MAHLKTRRIQGASRGKSSSRCQTADNAALDPQSLRPKTQNTKLDVSDLSITDRCDLKEIAMTSVVHSSSLHPWTLSIIILCAFVSWPVANALAQNAAPAALGIGADSTSWSLTLPRPDNAPYLVITSAERLDTQAFGSPQIAGDQSTDTTAPLVGSASPVRAGTATAPLLLSSALDQAAGIRGLANFRSKSASARQTVLKSPDSADAEVVGNLDDRSVAGSFMYGYAPGYLPPKQWIADNASLTNEFGPAPRPVLSLEIGGWSLPVVLSQTSVSQ